MRRKQVSSLRGRRALAAPGGRQPTARLQLSSPYPILVILRSREDAIRGTQAELIQQGAPLGCLSLSDDLRMTSLFETCGPDLVRASGRRPVSNHEDHKGGLGRASRADVLVVFSYSHPEDALLRPYVRGSSLPTPLVSSETPTW